MKSFAIRKMERLSSIKAHTLRIWEARYAVFTPQRSYTNIRAYNIDDVAYCLNLSLLHAQGYKISQLVRLDRAELERRIISIEDAEVKTTFIINQLIVGMYSCDAELFESLLDDCIKAKGIDYTINYIIIPLLKKTDALTYNESGIDIHLAASVIRKKFMLGIEHIKMKSSGRIAMLFLPREEHYDLTLLYMTYVLKKQGITVLYLGSGISEENLLEIIKKKTPTALYTYITLKHIPSIRKYVAALQPYLEQCILYLAFPERPALDIVKQRNVRTFYFADISKTVLDEPELS